MKKVLTIAGSDSCGGAGIQADLKTISALGAYGMSVICAVTAQNTLGVTAVQEISKEIVEAQIRAIFDDISVDSVKIGMVSNSQIIKTIKSLLIEYKVKNIVLDPVMISKSGYNLLRPEAVDALKDLIGITHIVTPNIPEAEELTGIKISSKEDMKNAAIKISEYGVKSVLIKGGHCPINSNDILYYNDEFISFEGKRIETLNTHGTGCTLSSAIATYIAKGYSIAESVKLGKEYIKMAIENSFSIGHGVGPVGHFINLYKKAGVKYD